MSNGTGGRKMTCDKCGKAIPEDAVFCSYCGARCDEKKVCRACGTELQKGQLFCHMCGLKWEGDVTNSGAQEIKALIVVLGVIYAFTVYQLAIQWRNIREFYGGFYGGFRQLIVSGMSGVAIVGGIALILYDLLKIHKGKKATKINIVHAIIAGVLVASGFIGCYIGDLWSSMENNFYRRVAFVIMGIALQISCMVKIYKGKKITKLNVEIFIIFMLLFLT